VDIVDEGVNNKTRILLEYRDFHGKNVDEALYLLGSLLGIHLNLRWLVVFLDVHVLIHVYFVILLCSFLV